MDEMLDFDFKFGAKVRDRVTGFQGEVVACLQYSSRRIQYEVAPPLDAKGDMRDSIWIDECRLDAVD